MTGPIVLQGPEWKVLCRRQEITHSLAATAANLT